MPRALDILGGLATIGAQGAQGAYTGQFEGEEVRRKRVTEDEQNKLRALDQILKGQQVQAGQTPQEQIHGGIIYRVDPRTGAMTAVGPAPQAPPTPLQAAQTKHAEAQAAALEREKGTTEGQEKGKIIAEYMRRLGTEGPQAAQAWLDQTLKAIHAAESKGAASGAFTLSPGARRYDESGRLIAEAPPKPHAGLGDRTTTTTTTKVTPRKPIATDSPTFSGINKALPDVVNEITGTFAKQGLNFNVPGAWVKLPSGRLVRKEDIIAQSLLEKYGVEAAVRWEGAPGGVGLFGGQTGGRFVLTKAWEPAQREPVESVRSTGPARPAARVDDEED